MSLIEVPEKYKRLIRNRFKSGRYVANEFTNAAELADLPEHKEIVGLIKEPLAELGYELRTTSSRIDSGYVNIGHKRLDFQKHTMGIGFHTDDTKYKFGLLVLELSKRRTCTIYEDTPQLCHGGTRNMKFGDLREGSLHIFDARKEHAVIHRGKDYTVMLFDVVKIKKQKELLCSV